MSKLLIVDDSKDLLEAMEIILLQKGYTVKTLAGCIDIFHEVQMFNPDLVILDIFLAGQDGREICKELKKNFATSTLCVLVFSATPRALENYNDYCADGYLEKPFGINNLVDKIEDILSKCEGSSATLNS